MNNSGKNIFRRDFLKGLSALPFLGYFGLKYESGIKKIKSSTKIDYHKRLQIGNLKSSEKKLISSSGQNNKVIRMGLIGHGWRGERLLESIGYVHPERTKENTINGKPNEWLRNYLGQENLNVVLTGICDTFDIHANRGVEISLNPKDETGKGVKAIRFANYREMMASNEIDAIMIATPDHTHAPIAIAAAQAGKHVYLEKPMTHSIEEAISLRDVIKSTGIVFQLGHENRQHMSFRIARELYEQGILGTVSMVQTYTNRNTLDGAWIRKRRFDHLGNPENINWKEFLAGAPWHEFDPKRYFNWHRYSEYGTSVTGNDFSHRYDCVNQILKLGIPESVMAAGGQYFYKDHGDMPDVLSAVFNYPEKCLTMTYDSSLKNGIYKPSHILGSEASMDIDNAIMIFKDTNSERYKNIRIKENDPLYCYEQNSDVDAVSTATSRAYSKGGYGQTFIDGKLMDVTFLHVKEWIDAIRGITKPSCNIDDGFEEAVTFNMANLAYASKRPVNWNKEKESVTIV